MSIHWIREILIDNSKATLNIRLGNKFIGDRCYAEIMGKKEIWFNSLSKDREEIIEQGLDILKRSILKNKVLKNRDGSPFK